MPAGGMATAALISGGAQAAGSLISGITGIFQKAKGNRILRQQQYPMETVPTGVIQNQEQAQINANTGLPSAQYNQAMKDIQNQQLMALRGANDRRGGLGLIGSLDQYGNNAVANLGVQSARQRLQNQQVLYGANNQLAGWQQRVFQHNVVDKYNRDYNYAMGLLGMGHQNFSNGLIGLGAGAGEAGYGAWKSGAFSGGGGGGGSQSAYNPYTDPHLNQGMQQNQLYPSDERLKENYFIIGKSKSGINIYEFSYKGSSKRYQGVMADEVPFASKEINGYMYVDYSKIDVEFNGI